MATQPSCLLSPASNLHPDFQLLPGSQILPAVFQTGAGGQIPTASGGGKASSSKARGTAGEVGEEILTQDISSVLCPNRRAHKAPNGKLMHTQLCVFFPQNLSLLKLTQFCLRKINVRYLTLIDCSCYYHAQPARAFHFLKKEQEPSYK